MTSLAALAPAALVDDDAKSRGYDAFAAALGTTTGASQSRALAELEATVGTRGRLDLEPLSGCGGRTTQVLEMLGHGLVWDTHCARELESGHRSGTQLVTNRVADGARAGSWHRLARWLSTHRAALYQLRRAQSVAAVILVGWNAWARTRIGA
jgi:hypothetical protein